MGKFVTAFLFAALVAGCSLQPAYAEGERAAFKAVIHVNFADAERQKNSLRNVSNMLKEVKDISEGDIEVAPELTAVQLLVRGRVR